VERDPTVWKDVSLTTANTVSKGLFEGPLKLKTGLFQFYTTFTAVVTNEPALYLYKTNNKALKASFDIQNYYLEREGKMRFNLSHRFKNSAPTCRFKLAEEKEYKSQNCSSADLISLLEKYTITN